MWPSSAAPASGSGSPPWAAAPSTSQPPMGSSGGRLLDHGGKRLLVLSRGTAPGTRCPRTAWGYAAMARAARILGARACLATAAVGSLREEWGPGTLVAARDFLDLTYRNVTLHDRQVVHTDFSDPFPARRGLLQDGVVDGGVVPGPQRPPLRDARRDRDLPRPRGGSRRDDRLDGSDRLPRGGRALRAARHRDEPRRRAVRDAARPRGGRRRDEAERGSGRVAILLEAAARLDA